MHHFLKLSEKTYTNHCQNKKKTCFIISKYIIFADISDINQYK